MGEPEERFSRKSSSDYSDIDHLKIGHQSKNEEVSEITEIAETVVAQSVKEKVTKYLEAGYSTDSEPPQERPLSSDYSDIFDKIQKETEISEKPQRRYSCSYEEENKETK